MQVPESFQLPNPLDPERFPPPAPPKFLKHQVYETPEVFQKVDQHAIQVSRREHMTFKELMFDLVYRVRLQELEKARVIFRWMTSKNMYEIQFAQEEPGTPENILTSFRKRKGTLARILEVMCCYAHIPCVSISGYAKGVEYLPGQKFHGRPANHSWNAIFIQGAWQLIDAHWATRYLSSDKNVPENLVYEYDDFYFIMEPQQAVYSHFPSLETWQLLERPLTLQQFEDLPLTKSQFFKCGMDFRQQHHGVVHTREGKLKMCLGFWKPGIFTYGLQYGEAMEESFAGTPLKNYALQETLENQLNFFFRLPLTGVYYLTVYASDASASFRSQPSFNAPGRGRQVVAESVFRAACEYKLVCDTAAPDATPYPACHDVNWGPAWPLVQHYGLEPSVHDGVIPTHTGSVEVRFGRQRPDVNLLSKLRRNGIDDDILDQFQQEYVTDDTGEVVFTVQLPEGGEYGMEIYANDPDCEGDTYTHICQYMLYFQAPPGHRSKLQQQQQQSVAKSQGYQVNPRQMWNYEDHAPSMGTLPQPYLASRQDAVGYMTEGMSRMPYGGGQQAAPAGSMGSGAYQYHPGQQPEMAEGLTRGSYGARQGAQPGMGGGGAYQYHPGSQIEGSRGGLGLPDDFPPPPTDLPPPPPEFLNSEGLEAVDSRGNYRMPGAPESKASDQYDRQSDVSSALVEPVSAYRPEYSKADWSKRSIVNLPPPEFYLSPVQASAAPRPALDAIPMTADTEEVSTEQLAQQAYSKFEKIDHHAYEISQKTQENFSQLIWQLIYARNITDDLEKIRAIFSWLCTKDLSKMHFADAPEDSPEGILMGIKTGKSTYAQIFQTLCHYAQVHCNIIPGYAKGAEYMPGMRFSGRQGQHSWNAVLIDGIWRLVDCHWAARRLIGKQSSVENIRYELDMFYFLPNPIHLIFTHFPFDQEWQLLKDPIPLAEFESLAPVKSAFFKFGLQLRTHRFAVVSCAEELTLKLGHPPAVSDQLSFTYTLAFGDAVGNSPGETEEWQGKKLIQYGMQEMTPDDCSTFTIRPPRPGAYRFLIYAKRIEQNSPDAVFGAVCEYRIEADFPAETAMPPFPPCQNHSYGPCEAARRYRLVSSSPSAVLQMGHAGCVEVHFRLEQPGIRMMAKLRSSRYGDEQMARCLLMRHIADREVIVSVFPPDAGEYGLELYASDAKTEASSYYMVWQHLVIAPSPSPVHGLPTIPASFLGPLPRFSQFGLETVSHIDPFIQTNTGDLCVQLRLNSGPLRMMAQLIVATNDANDDCSQYVLQQSKNESVYFLLRFPSPGYYKFIVFALPHSDPSESIPAVFNYLVEASRTSKSIGPFPQQFQQWKDGCYLHSPVDGRIAPTGPYITFDMEVPKATAVAVVIGDDWTQLERVGGSASERWRADVYVEKHMGGGPTDPRRLSVCANYGSFNSSYSTILEYTM